MVSIKKRQKFKVNLYITASKIQLIDFSGKKKGIFSLKNALILAQKQKLDLVEVNSQITPPICKILDYKKYIYSRLKKKKV